MGRRVSVIIPVRNDDAALARTLDHLDHVGTTTGVEIIVGASGDLDGTTRAIRMRGRLVWPDGSTRAALMNAAAAEATGDVLLFLHADSLPPPDAVASIARVLEDERVVGGAFEHRFDEPGWSLRAISLINRVRYRLTRNYYGDQGLFVRADAFRQLGGFKDWALMEDLDLSQRLKGIGRTVLVRTPLRTSGRRFIARGPWRTFFVIVWLLLRHTLHLDTQRYAERWRGPGDRPPGSAWERQGAPER
ncbi:MAG: TIGR04283 family arsenosugar biosynthesis glycosyltransferase [Candidatus Rokubacteria bacterium]|nr:TIGR04283 family arsenosugar biosynthesis glycosyltransferase [Candidatus Rokubacteria bacterium]